MRPVALSDSLLLVILALGAAACGDSPQEPPVDAPVPEFDIPSSPADTVRWADGYLIATAPTLASYTPPAQESYNRSGGAITITKVSGTIGRYIATFRGLSARLGTKSTVQVNGFRSDNTFCKPMAGSLVQDKVEVRCFSTATGRPANAEFSLLVLGKSATRAAAFAHQPTGTNYAPQGAGSWNPAGTTRVLRYGTGKYQVVFRNLGTRTTSNGGQVQVHGVAGGKAHCRLEWMWDGAPDLSVSVGCYLPSGMPVDAKFTVLFTLPADHLVYTYSDQASASSTPSPFYSAGRGKTAVTVSRTGVGLYTVRWEASDDWILDTGIAQVTPVGEYEYGHCKISVMHADGVGVRCFAPNGTPADSRFAVLLGS